MPAPRTNRVIELAGKHQFQLKQKYFKTPETVLYNSVPVPVGQ